MLGSCSIFSTFPSFLHPHMTGVQRQTNLEQQIKLPVQIALPKHSTISTFRCKILIPFEKWIVQILFSYDHHHRRRPFHSSHKESQSHSLEYWTSFFFVEPNNGHSTHERTSTFLSNVNFIFLAWCLQKAIYIFCSIIIVYIRDF